LIFWNRFPKSLQNIKEPDVFRRDFQSNKYHTNNFILKPITIKDYEQISNIFYHIFYHISRTIHTKADGQDFILAVCFTIDNHTALSFKPS